MTVTAELRANQPGRLKGKLDADPCWKSQVFFQHYKESVGAENPLSRSPVWVKIPKGRNPGWVENTL
ncbi:hypothetical protein M514_08327 [Trichuris suis]|uniref:Uncharacterized protein n=1 Tax=Trichuris suis TaxID=68888 RepID=A0A085N1R1_9BILA|nr:hypothetical protein M513_08327 [Trichuris suis]KFD63407.1 hypothetical protein M514_08327 [Trichuris suis]